MYKRTRIKMPKGAWVELKSKDVLRAMIKQSGRSNRKFAHDAGVNSPTIDHLLSTGKAARTGCTPENAQRIADELRVPLDVLFEVKLPMAVSQYASGRVAA